MKEKGFILLYVLVAIVGFTIAAGAALPSIISLQRVEQAKKTAAEIAFIQDAALYVKKETGSHASSCSQLVQMGRLPSYFNETNPFGNSYNLDTSTGQVEVWTVVPPDTVNIFMELLPNVSTVPVSGGVRISSNAKSP